MLMNSPSTAGTGAVTDQARLEEIARACEALRAENVELRSQIQRLGSTGASAAGGVTRAPALDDLVAEAVARWMRENAAEVARAVGDADSAAAAADFNFGDSLNQILTGTLPDTERDAIWNRAHESGKFKDLLAALEARAAADPNNAQLQFELGYGYLQPIIHGEATGVEAGEWSMKSDRAYDAALAIDPSNWDARFNKAVSYSFWPPIMGKQPAAIEHFEILIEQQSRMAPAPEFAQTYLYLGNMYEQTGQSDKAKQTWNLGLAAFPQNADLRNQLGLD
jgi:tetratricopeptide (TPR) repeat protein